MRPYCCPVCRYVEDHPGKGVELRHCHTIMRQMTTAEFNALKKGEKAARDPG